MSGFILNPSRFEPTSDNPIDDIFRLPFQDAINNSGSNSDVVTVTGTSQFGAGIDGYAASAFHFDGSSYMQSDSDVAPLAGTLPFSYCFWVRLGTTAAQQMLASHGTGNNDKGLQQFQVQSGGSLIYTAADGSGSQNWSLTGTTLSADVWYHIIATWDGTTDSNGVKMWVSTIAVEDTVTVDAQGTANSLTMTPTTDFLTIGAAPDGTRDLTAGTLMSDFRAFDRVLTEAERSAVYSGELNTIANSIFHAPFDNALTNFGDNNETLAVTGTTTYADDQGGNALSAFSYNGSTDIDSSGKTLAAMNAAFTVSGWFFNTDISSARQEIVSHAFGANSLGIDIYTDTDDNLHGQVLVGADGSRAQLDSSTTLVDSTWYHFIMTWDGTTGTDSANMYISTTSSNNTATADNSDQPDTTSASAPSFNTSYGNGPSSATNELTGREDDMRWWTRVLDADERSDVYERWKRSVPTVQTKMVDFDGSTEYLANTTDQSLGIGNAWTISVWANYDVNNVSQTLCFIAPTGANTNRIIFQSSASAVFDMQFNNSTGGGGSQIKRYTWGTVATSTRTMVTATWDGTNFLVYQDGVEDTSPTKTTDNSGTMSDTSRTIGLGAANTDTTANEYFNGNMAVCSIWDTDLSGSEITALYDSGDGFKHDARETLGNYTSVGNLQQNWLPGHDSSDIGRNFVPSGGISGTTNAANIAVADIGDY